MHLTISEKGYAFIRHHELPGGRIKPEYLRPYDDGSGQLTIGCGHLIKGEERFEQGITMQACLDLFRTDCAWVEDCINDRYSRTALQQHQVDALADFIFNVGEDNFVDSGVDRAVVSKPLSSSYVPSQMALWTRGNGIRLVALVRRRAACALLWHFGTYEPYARGNAL